MNIQTAAIYVRAGCDIRRECWEPHYSMSVTPEGHPFYCTYGVWENGGYYSLTLDDLLADDWQIVTT